MQTPLGFTRSKMIAICGFLGRRGCQGWQVVQSPERDLDSRLLLRRNLSQRGSKTTTKEGTRLLFREEAIKQGCIINFQQSRVLPHLDSARLALPLNERIAYILGNLAGSCALQLGLDRGGVQAFLNSAG